MSRLVATFSIVGYDPANGDLGIAVQSKFLAVGAVVPWARAGVGAVATQAFANTEYGPKGLDLMASGLSAPEALAPLIEDDPGYDVRQVALVDANGEVTAHTGEHCLPWAGDVQGKHCTAQGNILVGEATARRMVEVFGETEGDLAERLVTALTAGQEAGGDSRGKQSAALLVVRDHGGYGGRNDRFIDIHVDDHPEPIKELQRILGIWRVYFGRMQQEETVGFDRDILLMCQAALRKAGYYSNVPDGKWSEKTQTALAAFAHDHDIDLEKNDSETVPGELFQKLMEAYQAPAR